MAVRLVLLRHGQTDWNAAGRMQGHVNVPLNDRGMAQADAAAGALVAARASRIISSDLDRAAMTAAAVARTTGLSVTHDARLREIGYGQWEGKTRDEIGPDVLAEVYASAENRRGVDGERLTDAAARVADALREIETAAADDDTVLVVTHGTVARCATQSLLGIPHACWEGFRTLGNCHWLVLERDRELDRWQLVAYNVGA